MCNTERSNAIGYFVILSICLQENNEPCVTEQRSSMKTPLTTMEETKNGHFLVSSVIASNDNSSKLEEPQADVTPLCVRRRTNKFVYSLAGAKLLTDKSILGIDECSLRVFPFAFAMYNAFYWMDYLWKDIALASLKMTSKLQEPKTVEITMKYHAIQTSVNFYRMAMVN